MGESLATPSSLAAPFTGFDVLCVCVCMCMFFFIFFFSGGKSGKMCGRKSANLARIWRWKIGEKCGAVEPRKGVFSRIFLRPRHCQILNNLSVIGLVMGHSPTSSPFGRNISSRNPVVPCSLDSPTISFYCHKFGLISHGRTFLQWTVFRTFLAFLGPFVFFVFLLLFIWLCLWDTALIGSTFWKTFAQPPLNPQKFDIKAH